MKPRVATSHAGDAARPADPAAIQDGAVLRGLPLHREPRTLARPGAAPAARPRRVVPAAPAPSEAGPVDEPADGARADREDRSAAGAPLPPTPFQLGFEAGVAAAHLRAHEAELERARRAGLEQGLREGRDEGLARGREEAQEAAARDARAAREETAARLERLDALLAQLPAELARRLASAEDDLVSLCHAVVCRILGERLVAPEGVAHVVRQAVREACGGATAGGAGRAPLAIRVHPRDLEALERDEALAAWLRQADAGAAGAARWIADERVGLGGCIVDSGEGSLDARLETQLAALRRLLTEGEARG